jgi:NADH-quinone oxidoreductase subunit J
VTLSAVVLYALAALAVCGALVTVLVREIMRMLMGLGAFLLSLAGLFAYFGFGFLALAELFVYVGGVLVLFVFAIMLVHRAQTGNPELEHRDRFVPAFVAVCSSVLLGFMFWPMAGTLGTVTSPGGPEALGGVLTGPMLPAFEIVGALLLMALVAVVLIAGGERE